MTLLSFAILGFGLLSLLHFTYDAILLPSFHLKLRFQLFALRDIIRDLMSRSNDKECELLESLHDAVNGMIPRVHAMNIEAFVLASKSLAQHPELKERAESLNERITECGNLEIQSIDRKIEETISSAILVNCGMWFLYLIPTLVFFRIFKAGVLAFRALFNATERELQIILPDSMIVNATYPSLSPKATGKWC